MVSIDQEDHALQPLADVADLIAAVNRLDRLTSGLMILALSAKRSQHMAREFRDGMMKKEYIARVKGEFPEWVILFRV